jgi:Tfp pilus assembly protein PilN
MRAVNLLPRDVTAGKRSASPVVITASAGGVAVVAISALLFLNASGSVSDNRQQLELAQNELALVPQPVSTDANAALTQQRDGRVGAVGTALASRVAWDRILREISLVLPEDVWFTSLTSASTSPAAPVSGAPAAAGPRALTIVGFTYSQEAVARLLTRLAVVPHLGDVKLQKSEATELAGRRLYSFTVLAAIKGAGGTA